MINIKFGPRTQEKAEVTTPKQDATTTKKMCRKAVRCVIPYVMCVVCVALDNVVFRGDPCPPIYTLGG